MNTQFLADFYEDGIFHVYNRTNNREPLFKSDENRRYFLKQFTKYLQPFLHTYCWCLLPNHFHFLVKVKDEHSIKKYLVSKELVDLKPIEKKYLSGEAGAETLLELEWKRFFTSYSMSFNKQNKRSGNLFHRPFKRVEIKDNNHFTQVVIYIHANPLKHGIESNFKNYKWSSWQSIVSSRPTLVLRNELLDWFGGLNRFIEIHEEESQYYYICAVGIEDD